MPHPFVHPPVDPAWFDAMAGRTSRRAFDGRGVDAGALDRIEALCGRLGTTGDGARAVLVREAPSDMFTGMVGSYGTIRGARSALAFIGGSELLVGLGYVGEASILEATIAGLDTCWVAGTFDAERTATLVELAEGERVQAVTPLGHAPETPSGTERLVQALVKARKRLPLPDIAAGVDAWPGWAREAAEAVRIGPSGGNAQSWRLRMEGDSLIVACKPDRPYWTWPFDCGIAMLHAELGALRQGVTGEWELLAAPDVARFVPTVDS